MVRLDDLERLLALDEGESLEFKRAETSYSYEDTVRYCAALANEGGGYLILGVSDRKPHVVLGSRAFEGRLQQTRESLIRDVHLRIDVTELHHSNGRLVVFEVPARPIGMPIQVDGGRYLMRAGEALVPMSADRLQQIFQESGPDYSALLNTEASIDDLDESAIEEFRRLWVRKSGNQTLLNRSVPELLTDAELVVNGKVTNAALILMGTKEVLGRLLPQSEVIFEYRSSDVSGPPQARTEWRHGFFSSYDQIWKTIDLRNTVQHLQEGLFVWDIKTFNEGAIREAVLNAVCHRDYRLGGSVFVRQYPLRLEVVSPGGLVPGITFDNILWEQAPRNRRMAEVFSKCGLVERSGQGMNRIFEACIRESKATPDFRGSDEFHFWMTLQGQIRHPQFLLALGKIGDEQLATFSTADFLLLQQIAEGLKIDERFQRNLETLATLGVIEKSHRRGHWVLSRKVSAIAKAKGSYTRSKGLDRNTNKELLLSHVQNFAAQGSKMDEFRQVLPFLERSAIQVLLRELRVDKLIHSHGATNGARWYPGPETTDCNHPSQRLPRVNRNNKKS